MRARTRRTVASPGGRQAPVHGLWRTPSAARTWQGASLAHSPIAARDLARVIPASWQEAMQNWHAWTWEDYLAPIPPEERGDLVQAYHRRLMGDDARVRQERILVALVPGLKGALGYEDR